MKLIDFLHLQDFVLYDAMQKTRNFNHKCPRGYIEGGYY